MCISKVLFIVYIMDWTLCIVCQAKSQEVLKCPLNAWGKGDKSKPYEAFLTSVNGFRELNQLPVPLKFGKEIDVGQVVTHKAKWHKSCHLKFSESKLVFPHAFN